VTAVEIPERYVWLCVRVGPSADRAPGNFTRLLTEQLTTADLLS
jgi:hypothetical protein